jgi:hypothetical protein
MSLAAYHSNRLLVLCCCLCAAAASADDSPKELFDAIIKPFADKRWPFLAEKERGEAKGREILQFSREHEDDPVEFEALCWVAEHVILTKSADKAMELLAKRHLANEGLLRVCKEIDDAYGEARPGVQHLFEAVWKESPHRDARAAAGLFLARFYKKRKENTEHDAYHWRLLKRGARVSPAGPPQRTDEHCDFDGKEAERILESLLRDYPNVKYDDGSIREVVEAELTELQHFSKDKPLLDETLTDVGGNEFKISDYEGKVVLFIFTSYSADDPFNAQLQTLALRHKDDPFMIVGIHTAEKKETVVDAINDGRLKGRCVWEKPFGPLARSHNFKSLPTAFIVDAKGMVRHKFKGWQVTEGSIAVSEAIAEAEKK